MINLVKQLFNSARKEDIPFVFIRPKDITEPDIYSGDFDLLIKPEKLNSFLSCVHKTCSEESINFRIKRVKKEKTNLTLFSKDFKNTVEFDLWTELDVRDRSFPRTTHISWEQLEKSNCLVENDFYYSLENNFSVLFYLSHLLSKNKDINSPEVKKRINYYRSLDNLDDTSIDFLSKIDEKTMMQANKVLNSKKLFSYSKSQRLNKSIFRLQKKLSEKSNLIAVIGPDGVGKTTIINRLEKKYGARYFRFKKLFRKSLIYKLLLMLMMKKTEKIKGASIQKNQFDDLHYSKLFWISLVPGYFLSLISRFGTKKIIDRYYMDLLISGSRIQGKEIIVHKLAKKLIKIIPTTQCVIQLDAPTEIVLSRKQELSAYAINKFREIYFDLAIESKIPVYIYINTKNSIDDTFLFLDKLELDT